MTASIKYKTSQTLAYAEYGCPDGFPILIQHGLIASIRGGLPLFQGLVDLGARLICPARPGYGASSPYEMRNLGEWGEIAAGLVEELKLSQFDVFGISSGAPYAYAIGRSLPRQVRNIFILSGTPALFDARVLAHWPYPVNQNASIAEMQAVSYELFFAHAAPQDLDNDDCRDALSNHCFGIAQDFKLRCVDWGFGLEDIHARVVMRHSRADDSVPLAAAEITARMLPNCSLEIRENDPHFSQPVVDDFIQTAIASHAGGRYD